MYIIIEFHFLKTYSNVCLLQCASIEEIFSVMNRSQDDLISVEDVRKILPIVFYQRNIDLCSNHTESNENFLNRKPKSSEG